MTWGWGRGSVICRELSSLPSCSSSARDPSSRPCLRQGPSWGQHDPPGQSSSTGPLCQLDSVPSRIAPACSQSSASSPGHSHSRRAMQQHTSCGPGEGELGQDWGGGAGRPAHMGTREPTHRTVDTETPPRNRTPGLRPAQTRKHKTRLQPGHSPGLHI